MFTEDPEKYIGRVATSILLMGVMGCARAEPTKVSTPPNSPTPETQQLPTPTPSESPTSPTETPQPIQPTPDQSSSRPPKPPTPTATPLGASIKIPEHLFPKDTTFFAPFRNPNVSGALLVRVDSDGNIIYAHGVKRNCTAGEEDISYLATKVPPTGIRSVVIKFNTLKTDVGLEIQPNLEILKGSVEFEALQLGAKTCPGGKVSIEAKRKGLGLENLGNTWNDTLVSVSRAPISSQAALDDLNGLCKACNIFSSK